MGKLNFDWLLKGLKATAAFSKKNLPSIMTGGSVILGWAALYFMLKEAPKAAKCIENKEQEREDEDLEPLSFKEKTTVYLQYCWIAGILGIGASACAIGANKISLDRIAELYMLTQFMTDKDKDKQKLIDRMKEALGDKKSTEIEKEQFSDDYPREEIIQEVPFIPGEGRTLFIDDTNLGYKFRSDIQKVKDGIAKFNMLADREWSSKIEKLKKDAFYSNTNDQYADLTKGVYVEMPMSLFLECIGEKKEGGRLTKSIGDLYVFRHYGHGKMCVNPEDIMVYDEFEDPATGIPAVCYMSYLRYMEPSDEFYEGR